MYETTSFKELIIMGFSYVWVVFIAILGGIVNHFSGIRAENKKFIWIDFGIDVLASGVVGVITYHVCKEWGISFDLTIAIAAIGGHMGARALVLFEHSLRKRSGLGE